jgi:hypothetical protein
MSVKKTRQLKKGVAVAKRQVEAYRKVAAGYSSIGRAKFLPSISIKKHSKEKHKH